MRDRASPLIVKTTSRCRNRDLLTSEARPERSLLPQAAARCTSTTLLKKSSLPACPAAKSAQSDLRARPLSNLMPRNPIMRTQRLTRFSTLPLESLPRSETVTARKWLLLATTRLPLWPSKASKRAPASMISLSRQKNKKTKLCGTNRDLIQILAQMQLTIKIRV